MGPRWRVGRCDAGHRKRQTQALLLEHCGQPISIGSSHFRRCLPFHGENPDFRHWRWLVGLRHTVPDARAEHEQERRNDDCPPLGTPIVASLVTVPFHLPLHRNADPLNCCSKHELASDGQLSDTLFLGGLLRIKLCRPSISIPLKNQALGAVNWNVPVWPLRVV
jgi:hypothetical protein